MMKKIIWAITFCFATFIISKAQTTNCTLGWHYNLGSDQSNDQLGASCIDASNNLFMAGTVNNSLNLATGTVVANFTVNGNNHAYVSKYDVNGNYLWGKVLEGNGTSEATAVGVDGLGNVYIAGVLSGTAETIFDPGVSNYSLTPSNDDMFIAKYDANGNFQWANKIGAPLASLQPFNMKVNSAGDIHIAGIFSTSLTPVNFNPAGTYTIESTILDDDDIFLAKYNSSCALQWAIPMGGSGSDFGYGVDVDANNNVYVTGMYSSTIALDPSSTTTNTHTSAGITDIFMAKYTVNGTLIYGSSIGGSGSDAGYRIKVSTNGDFYINGIFNSPGADVDPSISATTTLQCTGSGDNLFIGKYSGSNGDLIWAGEAGCSGDIQPFSIQEDFNGDIFICGKYNNVTDFDFSTSGIFTLTPLTSSSNSDIFISKYAGNGDFMYAGTIGGGTTNDNEGIYVHSIGGSSFILTGVFGESIDMDPSTATSSSLTANGGSDIFLAKYTICTEPGFATIIPSSSTVCANNTVSLTVGSGTLGSASNWVWYNGSCGTSSVGTGTLISVSPSVSTTYYVRGEGGCVTPTTCTSDMITVIPSKDIVGNVTSAVSSTLQGNVVLFEFQNQLAKWDSITSSSINGTGQFSLNAITSTSYILQFIPDNNSHQVSYAPNAVAWKDASVFSHGCLLNTTKDVTVAAFPTFTPGPGIISGKIVEGQGYGQKGTQITVPGNPIGGLNIKVGKNPGGNYQAQSRSDGAGGYTISGLPINQVGENYFIYVDIPGIDTSGTYYVTITGTNAVFNNLDFIADSDYVYNAFFLSIDELNQKKAEVFVYPNPANEQITIDLFGLKENSAKITLHSLTGKLVFEKKVDYDKSDPKAIINTKDFENGVYLFGLEVEGVLRQRKLIIRH